MVLTFVWLLTKYKTHIANLAHKYDPHKHTHKHPHPHPHTHIPAIRFGPLSGHPHTASITVLQAGRWRAADELMRAIYEHPLKLARRQRSLADDSEGSGYYCFPRCHFPYHSHLTFRG